MHRAAGTTLVSGVRTKGWKRRQWSIISADDCDDDGHSGLLSLLVIVLCRLVDEIMLQE